MIKFKYCFIICCFLFVTLSCTEKLNPKPKAYLRLHYPKNNYTKFLNNKCPYVFDIADKTILEFKKNCWIKIKYPTLKATLHITYRNVTDNLNAVLKEVEKITLEHTIKADAINSIPYESPQKKVYGTIYNVEGNAASNLQFRVTDSLNHVLAGSLYFYAKPNYDSIQPAIKHIEKDIVKLIETLEWKY